MWWLTGILSFISTYRKHFLSLIGLLAIGYFILSYKQLKEKVQILSKQNQLYQQLVLDLRNENKQLLMKIDNLQVNLKKYQQAYQDANRKLNSVLQANRRLTLIIKDLKRDNKKYLDEIKRLQQQIEKLSKKQKIIVKPDKYVCNITTSNQNIKIIKSFNETTLYDILSFKSFNDWLRK